MSRARTQLAYSRMALASLEPAARALREAYGALARAQAARGRSIAGVVRELGRGLDAILVEAWRRHDDPEARMIEQDELMTVPLFMLAEQRRESRFFMAKGLSRYEIHVELELARATLEWLDEPEQGRRMMLREAIIDGLASQRSVVDRELWAQERLLEVEGVIPRRERREALALRLERERRLARRLARKAARAWYRRSLRPRELHALFPLDPKVRVRRGEVSLIEVIDDASDALAYEYRMFMRECDYLYEEVGKDMRKFQRDLDRKLPSFAELARAVVELIEREVGDRGRMSQVRDAVGTLSHDMAASLSDASSGIARLRSEAKSMLACVGKPARALAGAPSHIYQAGLRWRRIPGLANTARFHETILAALGALGLSQAQVEALIVGLRASYEQLERVIEGIEAFARRNEKAAAKDMRARDLEALVTELEALTRGDFLVRHEHLHEVSKAWNEAADKLDFS